MAQLFSLGTLAEVSLELVMITKPRPAADFIGFFRRRLAPCRHLIFGDRRYFVFGSRPVAGAEIHPPCSSFDFSVLHILEFVLNRVPNQSPEPTAVGAVCSAVAVHVAGRRWLSFLR